MALAKAEQRCELLDANPSSKICVDIRHQPPPLPSHQTSGCDSSIYGGSLRAAQLEALLSLKKRDGTRDVRTGSFAVTVTRLVCRLDELRRGD